jgi:hypothetical protein
MKNSNTYQQIRSFNPLFSVLIFVGVLVGLFFAAQFIYTMLLWASPVVLLITCILDYKVPVNFVKLLIAFTRKNTVAGIVFIALSIVFFPIICLFLLGKALFNKKVEKIQQRTTEENNTFVPYEEVEDEPIIIVPRKNNEVRYNYDKLFKDA